MKIAQRTFFGRTTEFELTESAVRVSIKKRSGDNSYEIPLATLKPTPSYNRHFSGVALAIAISSYLFASSMVIGAIYPVQGVERSGFVLLSVIGFFVAVRFTLRFLRTTKDVVIWYSTRGHTRGVIIDRRLPTETQASEFARAINEKLTSTRLGEKQPNQSLQPTRTSGPRG